MKKEDIYRLLNEKEIAYTAVDHPAAFTVEDIDSFHLPMPQWSAKNLFLRDDRKRNYYLLTVREDTPVNLRAFQEKAGTRRLSFASEADLMSMLGLWRGAVTPFGILQDESRSVQVYLDSYFAGHPIWVHPNDNTASVLLETADLEALLKEHGNPFSYFDFSPV